MKETVSFKKTIVMDAYAQKFRIHVEHRIKFDHRKLGICQLAKSLEPFTKKSFEGSNMDISVSLKNMWEWILSEKTEDKERLIINLLQYSGSIIGTLTRLRLIGEKKGVDLRDA